MRAHDLLVLLCCHLNHIAKSRRLIQLLNRLSQLPTVCEFRGKKEWYISHRSDNYSGESMKNGHAQWFHELYRRFPGIHCGAREITAFSMERTDISQISRSSSVPTCRVRVSKNLEGTLDGVPAAFCLAVTYVLSALVRVSH